MDKQEILKIIGDAVVVTQNTEDSALVILIEAVHFDVLVTVPYQVTELFFEVKDKEGNILLTDHHDFYGITEIEDFKESLLEIADIVKSPDLRVVNNGKTVQAKGYEWYYWFGEFIN
ncbi:hypothetical protein H8K33_13570 [Undibacterium amnicola]|uniref:Uncharacterized protein n=1 Tax=Undibacterium amnicola TaxID=1834038 RepID=A0ABR6XSU3_9BURK|nr:hypothetical protein [Undibacterium amnicola]MBC3832531.1 hypothetical protein [Undibacterium amnicola]